MKRYVLALIALLTVATSIPAAWAAEDEESGYSMRQYLSMGAGSYLPTHRSSSQGNGFEGGYGIAPLPYLAFETNAGYLQQEQQDSNFMAVSLTETAKALYSFGLGSIYALAGGGVYYTAYHFNGDHQGQTFPTADDNTALGYFYGGGADIYVRGAVTLGAEVKWLTLKSSFNKLRGTALNDLADRDYTGALILAKLNFNF